MTFQVGDVVRLNSGGQPMTVRAVDGPSVSVVFWADDTVNYLSFPQECLTHDNPHSTHDECD